MRIRPTSRGFSFSRSTRHLNFSPPLSQDPAQSPPLATDSRFPNLTPLFSNQENTFNNYFEINYPFIFLEIFFDKSKTLPTGAGRVFEEILA